MEAGHGDVESRRHVGVADAVEAPGLDELFEPVFLSSVWRVRDRMGGDINLAVDDDRTSLSATTTVKPG